MSDVRVVLAFACTLHFCVGALVGLSVDEAHYALYATHLDWSYFDHPPLVGWVQWPLVALHAPTAVLRLLPELLWLATAVLVYAVAERLQASNRDSGTLATSRAGYWAVLVFALAPLFHVLGIGLLPDTLLVFFTAALMWLTQRLMEPTALHRAWLWLAVGLVLGFAGLSKYTAILQALAFGGCLLLVHGRALVSQRWLWWSVLIAVLLVTPVVYWNYGQDWISFTYQARHGAGGDWQWVHVLRFVLLQLLVYGPLLLWGFAGVFRCFGQTGQAGRALALFFLIPFPVFAALSGGGSSLPHWTAPAWVALAPFAGLALADTVHKGWRALRTALAWVQGLISVAALGLMLTAGWPFSWSFANPFADVHGWDQAGARALALAAQHGLTGVGVQNWTLASRLGWYARPLPVYVLQDRFDQFDLWAGDLPPGGSTLLVDWSQMSYTVPLGSHGFGTCTLLDTQAVARLGVEVATFRFYACHNWSGAPQPIPQGKV
ncbi:MAG: glycosyltransferase family 39 protein [Rhodoferax sp.]|nr:glycosyltransferase family 39 protein [Rhodoferax sp.]